MTQSLWQKAKSDELPELQIMDIPTLEEIKKASGYLDHDSSEDKIRLSDIEIAKIIEFTPEVSMFLRTDHTNTIHGLSHIGRVIVNTVFVTRCIGYDSGLLDVCLLAAELHDLRRQDDKGDIGHGNRAWNWFLANIKFLETRHPELFSVLNSSPKVYEMLKLAIVYHEVNYEDIPGLTNRNRNLLDILKTADALDRYRLPKAKWFPNPQYIKLKKAIPLIPLCRNFTIETEELILNGVPIINAINGWIIKNLS